LLDRPESHSFPDLDPGWILLRYDTRVRLWSEVLSLVDLALLRASDPNPQTMSLPVPLVPHMERLPVPWLNVDLSST